MTLSDDSLNDPALQEALVECLERLEKGESLEEAAIYEMFPKQAEELLQFLWHEVRFQRIAAELRDQGLRYAGDHHGGVNGDIRLECLELRHT